MQEGQAVGAGGIEDVARRKPAARHAQHRCHQHQADADTCFARRQVLADDHGIHRHDAALEEPEQPGDHIERRLAVEKQIEQQRKGLHGRADDQHRRGADPVGECTGSEAADHAKAEHQGDDLRTDGDAITKVAAIGDDMDLRHRNRHAAGKACNDKDGLQHVRLQAKLDKPNLTSYNRVI